MRIEVDEGAGVLMLYQHLVRMSCCANSKTFFVRMSGNYERIAIVYVHAFFIIMDGKHGGLHVNVVERVT